VLKSHRADTQVCLLEPVSCPLISAGKAGVHRVEGIASGFVPPLLNRGLYDEVMLIEEDEARATARLLAAREGIFAGTSSGMNVAGALRMARRLGPGHTVVTAVVDSGLRYLSTDLYPAA
jgi:cysteine synthase A